MKVPAFNADIILVFYLLTFIIININLSNFFLRVTLAY